MNLSDLTTTLPTRTELQIAWKDWLESKRDQWALLTITVVFQPIDLNNSQARWEDEYKKRVLQKFRRALESNPNEQAKAIPYEEFFYFERDEASIFRATGSRKPFHIHGLLPIRKSQFYRVWLSDSNTLKERLQKDLASIDTVQSVLVEKVSEGKTLDWIRYMSKGKPF